MHIGELLVIHKRPTPIMPAVLSVRSAVARLVELDHKAAMVIRADGTFSGVVCEASLIAAISQHRRAAFDQPVGEVALDRHVAYCSVDDTLNNALRRLSEQGRSFLVVTRRMRPIDLVFRDELTEWWERRCGA
ncbi:CBS domain-containing protein [Bradyrhizobium sp. B124]|uniref:CBS domain-containing protein n=1 Tax=Bradyrhizobium sp. B124 TaxID=3140245 RepID=UPI0031845ACA